MDQARALLAHAEAVAGRIAAARETLARLAEDCRAVRATGHWRELAELLERRPVERLRARPRP